MVLERIDLLVFYFKIECGLCRNVLNASHVAIEELQGNLVCTLCGKTVKVPEYEKLINGSKAVNAYLSDKQNATRIKLVLNEKFVVVDEAPPAH